MSELRLCSTAKLRKCRMQSIIDKLSSGCNHAANASAKYVTQSASLHDYYPQG